MADQKITELASYTPAIDTDVVPIVDITTNTTKKITWANIKATLKTYFDTLYNVFINTAPTDLKISTSSKGGVFNGGFELGTGSQVDTSGWVGAEQYGWWMSLSAGTATASYDNTVSHSGGQSMKVVVSLTGAQTMRIMNKNTEFDVSTADSQRHFFPIKASTTYKISYWVKTNITSATTGFTFNKTEYASTFGANVNIGSIGANITTTTDWVLRTTTFTSQATAAYLALLFSSDTCVGTMWIDDIKLEEVVSDTTFTGKVAEKIRPVLQAVTSTDNIDQSCIQQNGNPGFGADGTSVNEMKKCAQSFTPTKKYLTSVVVQKSDSLGTPTEDVILKIVTDNAGSPGTTILASATITNAVWQALGDGAMATFNVPCILTPGILYWYVLDRASGLYQNTNYFKIYGRSTDGYSGGSLKYTNDADVWSTGFWVDNIFSTHYAKKSEGFTLIANGIKTELQTNSPDGLLSNAIIDLDNGKYRYDSGLMGHNDLLGVNDVFSASAGGMTVAAVINGWTSGGTPGYYPTNSSAANMVFKVNSILPIKHLLFKINYGRSVNFTFDISKDNINWTTLLTAVASEDTLQSAETDLLNGLSVFYLRFNKDTTNTFQTIKRLIIDADLDTSSIPQGLFYPLAINQFTETVKLPSTVDRVYYQSAKYTNEYGVVVPALEYCSTATPVGYTPLKLDNSQEANPCVSILSTTTNYQQSGTGSNVTGGVVLNTGEYITLTGATSEIKVDYQVGTGTTSIGAITKNALFLSSNSQSNDTTQDPSLQGNFIVGIRQQGLTDAMKDLRNHTEDIRKGLADTQQYVRNNTLITGFDAGTTDAYAITVANFTGYYTGMSVLFKANTVNTGACTLNINGMGAKAIVKGITTALADADILALMWCQCVYDGVAFVLINPRVL